MTTQLTPYVQFRTEAREAMAFYQSVFGGDLQIMTFADLGGMGMPEDRQDLVMHGALTVSPSLNLFGADIPPDYDVKNGHIALSGDDTDVLTGWFTALAEGGTVDVPLAKAPWGDSYGQVKDRFGIDWMVNIAGS